MCKFRSWHATTEIKKIKLPPCSYDQINRQYDYEGRGKMTWLRNRWKLKPPVKNGKKGSSLSMEKLLMFTRSMTNCIDEWTEYTLRHERWLWVWKNLMKVLRKHFVRVSYARTAQMVDIGILVIGILSTLAFLPVAFRVVAYCTLAFCQWVYCPWHYVYWHYSQWRFVLWRFICGALSQDRYGTVSFLAQDPKSVPLRDNY